MECTWCYVSASEEALYNCKFSSCPHSQKILCVKCGERVHHKITDHSFQDNKISLTNIKLQQKSSQKSSTKYPSNSIKHNDSEESSLEISSYAYDVIASSHPIGAVGSSLCQIVSTSYKYNNNQIVDENGNKDAEEYKRLVKRSIFVPVVSTVVSSSVAAIASKFIAVASPMGLPTVLILGLLYGVLGAILSRKAFDNYLPESSQMRKELRLSAVRTFGFFDEDLENENVFNKKVIEKRYKKLAKIYHPDRVNGDEAKFQLLEVYHRIVLSMLDDDSIFPMVKFDVNGVAYIDQSTEQRKAICCDTSASEVASKEERKWFGFW